MFCTPPPHPKKLTQPSRSTRLGFFQRELDTPPGMSSGAFIMDVILIGQPPRPDIQPHSQGVRFHIQPQDGDKFSGRPSPLWPFCRHQGGNSLQHRVGRLLPQLRFPPLQLPHKPFLVPFEVEALVLLIPPGNIQGGSVVRPPLFLEQEGPICRPQQAIGAGNHIKFIIGLLLAGVMYYQEADPAYIGKPFQFGDYLIVVGIAVLTAVLLPYFLQGVDDNEPGVRVFPDKAL